MQMIKDAVGPDLLWRPRHGRIRLKGRWIHFPLKPVDLLLRLPKGFTVQLLWDAATKKFRRAAAGRADVRQRPAPRSRPGNVRELLLPYMRKLWALPPEELAVTLATRRVSGSSIGKILKKILGQIPGLKKPQTGGFYYPRKGFGQISESLRSEAEKLGAEFTLEARITGIEHEDGRVKAVRYKAGGAETRIETDIVWSTLPLTTLVVADGSRRRRAEVIEAASRVRYRGMILIYLVLEQDQFTEYDAHYFPEYAVPISRLSEPKNYSASTEPEGRHCAMRGTAVRPARRTLGAEPMTNSASKLCEWLAGVGLPVTAKVRRTETRRLGFAYPVYDRGFEGHLKVLDRWAEGLHGLLTFGRQGLFAHDNTHHALAMADGAVDSLNADGSFDLDKWHAHRRVFETHVVED